MGALHKNRFIFLTFIIAAVSFGVSGEVAASNCAVGADAQDGVNIVVTGRRIQEGGTVISLEVSVDAVEGAKAISWVAFALNGQTVNLAAVRAANPMWTDIDIKDGAIKFGDFLRGDVFGIDPGAVPAAIAIPQFVNVEGTAKTKAGCSVFDVAITNPAVSVNIVPDPGNLQNVPEGQTVNMNFKINFVPPAPGLAFHFTVECEPLDRTAQALCDLQGICECKIPGLPDFKTPEGEDIVEQCNRVGDAKGECDVIVPEPGDGVQVDVPMMVDKCPPGSPEDCVPNDTPDKLTVEVQTSEVIVKTEILVNPILVP